MNLYTYKIVYRILTLISILLYIMLLYSNRNLRMKKFNNYIQIKNINNEGNSIETIEFYRILNYNFFHLRTLVVLYSTI